MLSVGVQSIISQTPCTCIQISRLPGSISSMLHTPSSLISLLRYPGFIGTDTDSLLSTWSLVLDSVQSTISQTPCSSIQISGQPGSIPSMLHTPYKPYTTSQIASYHFLDTLDS